MSCPACVVALAGSSVVGGLSMLNSKPAKPKTAVLFHLDLGIGGAEQLMVHLACSLQKLGYELTVVTSHHDKNHCFPPTRDGTLKVEVYGDWLPFTIFGRFQALCAVIRMVYCLLAVLLSGRKFELAVNDQVAAINPLLYMIANYVFFYCHFPDMLLCVDRKSLLKRLYRAPLDWLEELTTAICDVVCVNSKFTQGMVERTMPKAAGQLSVLYPPVDLRHAHRLLAEIQKGASAEPSIRSELEKVVPPVRYFLSLNRYERKKGIATALEAFAAANALRLEEVEGDEERFQALPKYKLVIAGGYDARVPENVEHLVELRRRARELGLLASPAEDVDAPVREEDAVLFFRSVSDVARWGLLSQCEALLYTPEGEHFGMVPCEAMAVGTPVIASAAPGGPIESVANEVTGVLCERGPEHWGGAVRRFMDGGDLAGRRETMGQDAKRRVAALFDMESFTSRIGELVAEAEGVSAACSTHESQSSMSPLSVATPVASPSVRTSLPGQGSAAPSSIEEILPQPRQKQSRDSTTSSSSQPEVRRRQPVVVGDA